MGKKDVRLSINKVGAAYSADSSFAVTLLRRMEAAAKAGSPTLQFVVSETLSGWLHHVKLTLGASRSAAICTSKKSRLAKPNSPATMFEGNIWVLLLKNRTWSL